MALVGRNLKEREGYSRVAWTPERGKEKPTDLVQQAAWDRSNIIMARRVPDEVGEMQGRKGTPEVL